MKKKVFVTGGSGFLGINLIRELIKKNYDVISYDLVPFEYECRNKIKAIVGDIRDISLLEKEMKDCEYVIHCAAALPSYTKEEIFSTDITGTENVIKTAYKYNVKRFVHISSTAVYGIYDHYPLLENDKLKGVGPYGIAKIEAEKVCIKYRKKGMNVPIFRPMTFVGPERLGVFSLFYDWAYTGHGFPMIGSGNNKFQLLDVSDFVDLIIATLTIDENKTNDTFNVGSRKFKTMKEDYQAVLNYAGYNKKIKPFPKWIALTGLRILNFLHISPLYKWVYETAPRDSVASIEKVQTKLGFCPKYSTSEALIRNYKWYVENLEKFKSKTGKTHRVPWKQGILKIVKKFY